MGSTGALDLDGSSGAMDSPANQVSKDVAKDSSKDRGLNAVKTPQNTRKRPALGRSQSANASAQSSRTQSSTIDPTLALSSTQHATSTLHAAAAHPSHFTASSSQSGPHSSTTKHKPHKVHSGSRPYARTSSHGKNLNKLAKIPSASLEEADDSSKDNALPAKDVIAKDVTAKDNVMPGRDSDALSKDTGSRDPASREALSEASKAPSSPSRPAHHVKRNSSTISLPRTGSKVSIRKNTSNVSLRRNGSNVHVARASHGHNHTHGHAHAHAHAHTHNQGAAASTAAVKRSDSQPHKLNRMSSKTKAKFSLAQDDDDEQHGPDQDDEWTEESAPHSPSQSRRRSKSPRSLGSKRPDGIGSDSKRRLARPPSPTDSHEDYSGLENDHTPHDSILRPRGLTSADAITARLLSRRSSHLLHPQLTSVSAQGTPGTHTPPPPLFVPKPLRNPDAAPRNSSQQLISREPSMPENGISRFLHAGSGSGSGSTDLGGQLSRSQQSSDSPSLLGRSGSFGRPRDLSPSAASDGVPRRAKSALSLRGSRSCARSSLDAHTALTNSSSGTALAPARRSPPSYTFSPPTARNRRSGGNTQTKLDLWRAQTTVEPAHGPPVPLLLKGAQGAAHQPPVGLLGTEERRIRLWEDSKRELGFLMRFCNPAVDAARRALAHEAKMSKAETRSAAKPPERAASSTSVKTSGSTKSFSSASKTATAPSQGKLASEKGSRKDLSTSTPTQASSKSRPLDPAEPDQASRSRDARRDENSRQVQTPRTSTGDLDKKAHGNQTVNGTIDGRAPNSAVHARIPNGAPNGRIPNGAPGGSNAENALAGRIPKGAPAPTAGTGSERAADDVKGRAVETPRRPPLENAKGRGEHDARARDDNAKGRGSDSATKGRAAADTSNTGRMVNGATDGRPVSRAGRPRSVRFDVGPSLHTGLDDVDGDGHALHDRGLAGIDGQAIDDLLRSLWQGGESESVGDGE